MHVLIALEKPGEPRPQSISIYAERIEAYAAARGVSFGTIPFDAEAPPGSADLIWAPGLGNRRVPKALFSTTIPTMATIHGLQNLTTPPRIAEFGLKTGLGNWVWRWRIRQDWRRLRRSIGHVVTVSEATRAQIVARLGVSAERITPIYHGVDARFHLDRPPGPGRFVFHISQYSGLKNLPRMIEAYRLAAPRIGLPLKAISVGAPESAVPAAGLPEGAELIRMGVPHEAVPGLFAEAHVFLFPSVDEPFGLPILEAMAAGVPVVTARGTGAAEVAGAAAVLVDPLDAADIAAGLVRAATDEALRARLIEAGLKRVREFSWERSGAEHLALMRRLAGK